VRRLEPVRHREADDARQGELDEPVVAAATGVAMDARGQHRPARRAVVGWTYIWQKVINMGKGKPKYLGPNTHLLYSCKGRGKGRDGSA
jgi:hypothetical protein